MSKRYPGVFHLWYRDRKGRRRKTRTLYLKYYLRGKPIRERTGLIDVRQAAALRRQRLTEIEERRYVGPKAERLTIEKLERLVKDEYVTIGRRTVADLPRRFKNVRAFFGDVRCVDIGLPELNAYVRSRRETGGAPGTIKVELAVLHHGLVLAVRMRQLPSVPEFPKLQVRNARRVFVDRPLLDRLLEHLPDYLRPVFLVALLTGWRKKAILSRQWWAVDFEDGWLSLEEDRNKSGEYLRVPLIPALREILANQLDLAHQIELTTGRPVPWCFFYTRDTAHFKAGARIVNFEHAWTETRKAVGLLTTVRFHDLRRGAIRTLRRAGASEHEVMEWVGLKTRAVFDRYDIVDEERRREVGAKLQGFYEGQAGQPSKLAGFTKKP